ncbi:MAG: DUF4369 domain-containing protein [Bacteroidaceae bacterium]|nr:DUF4369 domain-containing protein [Bacteroidaceae bacterium]
MRYIAPIFLSCLLCASCSETLNLQGSTSLSELENRTLHLKVFDGNDFHSIDSARVVHGKFGFRAEVDSAIQVRLFVDNDPRAIMPILLDGSQINVIINENEQKVEGSDINDSLQNFIAQFSDIRRRFLMLPRFEAQLILQGVDPTEASARLLDEQVAINNAHEKLVMPFIRRHMNDVLGSAAFMIVTAEMEAPMLTPWIEQIITFASPKFLSDPYVREFIRMAKENSQRDIIR